MRDYSSRKRRCAKMIVPALLPLIFVVAVAVIPQLGPVVLAVFWSEQLSPVCLWPLP